MFKEILLPIDLEEPDSSMKALSSALELCQGAGAGLHVLAVLPGFQMSIVSQYFPEGFEEKAQAEAASRLRSFIDDNVPSGIAAQAVVANGTIYEEILHAAKQIGCDLIVMAAHRRAVGDYLLGTNASRVVRHANCTVMVVRDQYPQS